jgi:hypothetical protein
MRWTQCALLTLLILILGLALTGQESAVPRLNSVEPPNGKVGDILTVTGSNLSKDAIAELYLTDGKNDTKADMTEQAAEAIKFKIPASMKAGRYSLMVLTRGNNPRLIEQPVKVTVE